MEIVVRKNKTWNKKAGYFEDMLGKWRKLLRFPEDLCEIWKIRVSGKIRKIVKNDDDGGKD